MSNETSQATISDSSGNPLGWWTLNQSAGTSVSDYSGSGDTATATGVTWGSSAASFSGASGQQVATSASVLNTTQSYSVSAWVNLASTAASQVVVGQKGTESSAFALQYDASAGHWGFARADTDVASPTVAEATSSTAATAGTWYHLVGTYNAASNAMTLYVNGRQAGTATGAAGWASTGDLVIGAGEASGAAEPARRASRQCAGVPARPVPG